MNASTPNFSDLLERELVCALGCTEPIAVAYACALAERVLETKGQCGQHLLILCSANIIKNVKSVAVPGAEGMKGVEVAGTLGAVAGDANKRLEVLADVTHEDVERTRTLLEEGFCTVELAEGVANLYIRAEVSSTDHSAQVTIEGTHTCVREMLLDGSPLAPAGQNSALTEHLMCADQQLQSDDSDLELLNISDIVTYAQNVDLSEVRELLERQISCNTAIARVGITEHWGSEIGKTLYEMNPDELVFRMRALAAAGSDARMAGCCLPVVINSGSGNQGITVSVPVVEYAHAIGATREQLLRALCVSNLVALHIKHYIGRLSAFCGVVCAAAGAGAAITYLDAGSLEQIGESVVNTIANIGGVICDGAKASCAAKIASAVDAAMLGHTMAMNQTSFKAGDGLVQQGVEETIRSIGYIGRVGMRETDIEVLNVMIGKTRPGTDCS